MKSRHARISDVIFQPAGQGFMSKSSAILTVPFKVPYERFLRDHLAYDKAELAQTGDIRGARLYILRGIPRGSKGGGEFHRVRRETLIVLSGEVECTCEDLYGATARYTLKKDCSVEVPPYVMHSYCGIAPESDLLVFANTLFDPDNPASHDTYGRDVFESMKQ